jgi:hypothetical protein
MLGMAALNGTAYAANSASGLYIWKIDGPGAGTKHFEKFTYDNAVMLEADILYVKAVNDASYLAKAQAIGNAMNAVFWNAQYKGYIFNTDPTQTRVNPAWCGWGSQGMIRYTSRITTKSGLPSPALISLL